MAWDHPVEDANAQLLCCDRFHLLDDWSNWYK